MPNRISGNTKSAPGNRHLDSTNPFAAPSIAEMTLAGMARITLLTRPVRIAGQTTWKLAVEKVCGRSHIFVTLTSAGLLSAVTTSAYTGIRKNSTSANRATYLPVVIQGLDLGRMRPLRPSVAGAAGRATSLVTVTSCAPIGPSTRCRAR